MAARRPAIEQDGFFDEPRPEPIETPKSVKAPAAKPKYSDLAPVKGRRPCADCAQLVYEQLQSIGRSTHLIREARVSRKVGEETLLLCAEHGQTRQALEAQPGWKPK